MNPDVSRALAEARNRLGLGSAAMDRLLDEYGDVESVDDLPKWLAPVPDTEE